MDARSSVLIHVIFSGARSAERLLVKNPLKIFAVESGAVKQDRSPTSP